MNVDRQIQWVKRGTKRQAWVRTAPGEPFVRVKVADAERWIKAGRAVVLPPLDSHVRWAEKRLAMAGSETRGQVLLEILDEPVFTDSERAQFVNDNWTACEAWGDDLDRVLEWIELLVGNGQTIGDDLPSTENTFTIYRATGGEEPGAGSWTTSIDTAQQFARMISSPRAAFLGMYSEKPVVWRGAVKRQDVLAYFGSRGESEVVTKRPFAVEEFQRLVPSR